MRGNAAPVCGLVGYYVVLAECLVEYLVERGIMHMVYMRKKMVCDMVIETTEDKIGQRAERVKIVGAFYLVDQPGAFYIPLLVGSGILRGLYMVGDKKSEQQEYRLQQVHGQESGNNHIPGLHREHQRQHQQVTNVKKFL